MKQNINKYNTEMVVYPKKIPNKILTILKKDYGENGVALDFKTPLQLLIATILSAQCTDKRVNIVTKTLFQKYKTIKDFANANMETFKQEIRSTGFYNNKAKNIIATAKLLESKFNGKVPDTMHELLTLPGVARKTANIVLNHAYNKIEGIAVDTHVFRLSQRLKFTKSNNQNKIEQDLMNLFPKSDWKTINHVLVSHGRKICTAKKPQCSICKISKYCPSYKKIKGWI